jgi:hypothetical protein
MDSAVLRRTADVTQSKGIGMTLKIDALEDLGSRLCLSLSSGIHSAIVGLYPPSIQTDELQREVVVADPEKFVNRFARSGMLKAIDEHAIANAPESALCNWSEVIGDSADRAHSFILTELDQASIGSQVPRF